MPDFDLNTVLLYLQQAQDANRFSQSQGNMSSSRIGPRLKAFQAVDEDMENSSDIDQIELIQQANLADVDENGLQEMVGLCNPDQDIDALLTLAGVICYWCGLRGHVVRECSTKCPECGALPSKIPGQKSQHKPQCSMKTFTQNRVNSVHADRAVAGGTPWVRPGATERRISQAGDRAALVPMWGTPSQRQPQNLRLLSTSGSCSLEFKAPSSVT